MEKTSGDPLEKARKVTPACEKRDSGRGQRFWYIGSDSTWLQLLGSIGAVR